LGHVGFNDGKTYEQGRPGYPEEALRFFADHFRIEPGSRVLDLGAGTGKLTRHLLAFGADVVAVEPSESISSSRRSTGPERALASTRPSSSCRSDT
jgi:cyclopropane fatty-acyl-phospholipid synthase-like methyltransferase